MCAEFAPPHLARLFLRFGWQRMTAKRPLCWGHLHTGEWEEAKESAGFTFRLAKYAIEEATCQEFK
jgi:hypothetical protein